MMENKESSKAGCASDLHTIVRIGESIRGVMGTAREVNLSALNAMLASRHSGERAVGFRVAASELRAVAAGLTGTMAGLSDVVANLVRGVATRQGKQRTHAYFLRTVGAEARAARCLGPAMERQVGEVRQLGIQLSRLCRELGRVAGRALRLCDLGLTLSRSARVEAAYGGEFAPVLKQVAEHLTQSIESVADTLRGLMRELAGARS